MWPFPWGTLVSVEGSSFLFLFFPRHTHTRLSVVPVGKVGVFVIVVVVVVEESEPRIEGGETDGRWGENQITPLTKSVCISKEGGAANPVGLLRRRQMSVRVQPR